MAAGLFTTVIGNIGSALARVASNEGDRYVWGGGHGSGIAQENFDCSGGVRKWVHDVTGEDIGPVTASTLYAGTVARKYNHIEVRGGSAALKTGVAGYWAYTGGSGQGFTGNHCGFWFVKDGELNVIHAKGRRHGVVLLKGAEAERYIDRYVLGTRGGRVFSLGTVSDRAFSGGIAEFTSGRYGNRTLCEKMEDFIAMLAMRQTEETQKTEEEKRRKAEEVNQARQAAQRTQTSGAE